ncbi:MAG: DUF4032 domain-containing protein [Acidobacteria bacterium]|nr:DUF4032 domain-containing protein [Acidobacteriota bacterium]
MPIQYRLDYAIDKSSGKSSDERALIRAVAGIKLAPSDATRVWPRILDHKWYLSERLGRDVGPRVAIIDYLENVEPLRRRVNGFGELSPGVFRKGCWQERLKRSLLWLLFESDAGRRSKASPTVSSSLL